MRDYRYKLLIAAMGPGEANFGVFLGDYFSDRDFLVHYALQYPETKKFFSGDELVDVSMVPTAKDLLDLIAEFEPDALILINSKMFKDDKTFRLQGPSKKPLAFTLDSNWLFSDRSDSRYKFLTWANSYLVNIPPKVFDLGLAENGGAYELAPELKDRIHPIGLIPAYPLLDKKTTKHVRKSIGVGDSKLIFAYGGFGVTNKPESMSGLFPAVADLRAKGKDIKILFVGEGANVPEKFRGQDWIIHRDSFQADAFYEYLASSDLVYQHQGLGTLSKAIAARIPAIANVANPKVFNDDGEHAHAWEVGPFARTGACTMLVFDDPPQIREKSIETLLYDNSAREVMQKAQQEISAVDGVPEVYDFVVSGLNKT